MIPSFLRPNLETYSEQTVKLDYFKEINHGLTLSRQDILGNEF